MTISFKSVNYKRSMYFLVAALQFASALLNSTEPTNTTAVAEIRSVPNDQVVLVEPLLESGNGCLRTVTVEQCSADGSGSWVSLADVCSQCDQATCEVLFQISDAIIGAQPLSELKLEIDYHETTETSQGRGSQSVNEFCTGKKTQKVNGSKEVTVEEFVKREKKILELVENTLDNSYKRSVNLSPENERNLVNCGNFEIYRAIKSPLQNETIKTYKRSHNFLKVRPTCMLKRDEQIFTQSTFLLSPNFPELVDSSAFKPVLRLRPNDSFVGGSGVHIKIVASSNDDIENILLIELKNGYIDVMFNLTNVDKVNFLLAVVPIDQEWNFSAAMQEEPKVFALLQEKFPEFATDFLPQMDTATLVHTVQYSLGKDKWELIKDSKVGDLLLDYCHFLQDLMAPSNGEKENVESVEHCLLVLDQFVSSAQNEIIGYEVLSSNTKFIANVLNVLHSDFFPNEMKSSEFDPIQPCIEKYTMTEGVVYHVDYGLAESFFRLNCSDEVKIDDTDSVLILELKEIGFPVNAEDKRTFNLTNGPGCQEELVYLTLEQIWNDEILSVDYFCNELAPEQIITETNHMKLTYVTNTDTNSNVDMGAAPHGYVFSYTAVPRNESDTPQKVLPPLPEESLAVVLPSLTPKENTTTTSDISLLLSTTYNFEFEGRLNRNTKTLFREVCKDLVNQEVLAGVINFEIAGNGIFSGVFVLNTKNFTISGLNIDQFDEIYGVENITTLGDDSKETALMISDFDECIFGVSCPEIGPSMNNLCGNLNGTFVCIEAPENDFQVTQAGSGATAAMMVVAIMIIVGMSVLITGFCIYKRLEKKKSKDVYQVHRNTYRSSNSTMSGQQSYRRK